MANTISFPYTTESGTYGSTLSNTYEWYVQYYQYPTITDTMKSSNAYMTINSIDASAKSNNFGLPSGYKRLEYIEMSGNQWIDTGYVANQNTRVVMDCSWSGGNAGGCFPFGTRTTYGQNAFAACFVTDQVFYDYGSQYQFSSYTSPYERMTIDANKNVATFSGSKTVAITNTSTTFTTPYNLILFSLYQSGAIASGAGFTGKFYSCKIYDNGTLIRDYLPCRSSDGSIGVYDVLNGKMYLNQGSDSFVASTNTLEEASNVIVNISVYSQNAITRTGTSGYTASTFTFISQPTIQLHNQTLGTSVTVYNSAISITVADNGSGTTVSSSITHSSTINVSIPSTWFESGNTAWYFTISDKLTVSDVSATLTNTKTFSVFNVETLMSVWVCKGVNLPDGYTILDYIESTGTQYIDTGFIPNQDTRIDVEAVPMSIADADNGIGFISYGAGQGYNSNAFECYTANGQFEFNYDGQYNFIGSPVINTKITISHNKNNVSINHNGVDDTLTFTYKSFTAPYTLTLFAINRGSAICGLLKLYSCKIYDNGTLIRNYTPCLNPSNVAGLYDTVNGVFYGNSGTGEFLYSITEYTPLEYIESDGTQYVDTGFKPNQNTRIVCQLDITPNSGETIPFGSADSGSSGYYYPDYTGSKWYYCYGTQIVSTGIATTTGLKIDLNKNTVIINDNSFSSTTQTFTGTYPISLFAVNIGGNVGYHTTMKLYSCKIYNDSILVRDYIPVLDFNGIACLFDKVESKFYYNSASSQFVASNAIGDTVRPSNIVNKLHKAKKIWVRKNGVLYPVKDINSKVGGSVV